MGYRYRTVDMWYRPVFFFSKIILRHVFLIQKIINKIVLVISEGSRPSRPATATAVFFKADIKKKQLSTICFSPAGCPSVSAARLRGGAIYSILQKYS